MLQYIANITQLTEPDSVIPTPIIAPPRMLLKTVCDVKQLAKLLRAELK